MGLVKHVTAVLVLFLTVIGIAGHRQAMKALTNVNPPIMPEKPLPAGGSRH